MQLYHGMPYVGMAPKKMVATLKVHKWHTRNVCIRLVNGLHDPYQALLSASMGSGPLTSLESITKVPNRQVAKTGKSSIFWLTFFLSFQASTITNEAITMIQTWKAA